MVDLMQLYVLVQIQISLFWHLDVAQYKQPPPPWEVLCRCTDVFLLVVQDQGLGVFASTPLIWGCCRCPRRHQIRSVRASVLQAHDALLALLWREAGEKGAGSLVEGCLQALAGVVRLSWGENPITDHSCPLHYSKSWVCVCVCVCDSECVCVWFRVCVSLCACPSLAG